MQRNKNNFDFIRFVAATMVILGHSYHLLLLSSQEPVSQLTGTMYSGSLGVYIFFVISGYLVTQSLERTSPRYHHYLWNRSLRIFPALVVVVVLSAFVLGPLLTDLSLAEYFHSGTTSAYLQTAALYVHYYLPGVFSTNPYPGAVNGSLWSIPIEFLMYLMLLGLGLLGVIKRRTIVSLMWLLTTATAILFPSCLTWSVPYVGDGVTITTLAIFFLSGMLFYLYRDTIPLDSRILIFLCVVWILSFRTVYCMYVSYVFIPYAVTWFAFGRISITHNFGRYGDFSYGMYLYAFPVQQTLIHFGLSSQVLLFFATFSITLPIAVLSWHSVESRALRLKRHQVFAGT